MDEFLENFDASINPTSANIHGVSVITAAWSAQKNKHSHAARE
ncbi:hypothetical protein [Herbaspirillum autotrophicum]|nr:hypothetical protein [Herbaspirillum autotrophicum]